MSEIVSHVEGLVKEKSIQIALVSGILFFIVANPQLFKLVEKVLKQITGLVGISLNLQGNSLLVFHSVVFTVLVALTTHYILEPLLHGEEEVV